MKRAEVIVVGAGSAGRSGAEALAQWGKDVLLVDGEAALPYKRTKLSKNLHRTLHDDVFALHPSSWYAHHGIRLMTGVSVHALVPEKQQIEIGEELWEYESLLLCTGARPRLSLPGFEQAYALWDFQEARILQKDLFKNRHLIVMGSGVLGTEVAWQGIQAGMRVSLIGRTSLPMEHYLDSVIAQMLQTSMVESGVEVHSGCCVKSLQTKGEDVWVETDGPVLKGDLAVAALGASPETRLAEKAGLAVSEGILVDAQQRTSHPHIWAAGDCTVPWVPEGWTDETYNTGRWHAAESAGQRAAASIAGEEMDVRPGPHRLKCESFHSYWFSAGNAGSHKSFSPPSVHALYETPLGLWSLGFQQEKLVSASGAFIEGWDGKAGKKVSELLSQGSTEKQVQEALDL